MAILKRLWAGPARALNKTHHANATAIAPLAPPRGVALAITLLLLLGFGPKRQAPIIHGIAPTVVDE
jgi:hypothetical protein